MATEITPRQAALWWAGKGHPVLPLHSVTEDKKCTCGQGDCDSRGKHPYAAMAPRGLKDATLDAATIKSWFGEAYWLSYGVVTNDLLVIDVDTKHGGAEKWKEICTDPARGLIHTWEIKTGSGGRHVMFKNTPGIRCGKLDKGIDIRGIDGYIVGPVCKHASGGTYNWLPQCCPGEGTELAEPPVWLINLIKTQSYCGRPKSLQDWRMIARTRVVDGARHDTLNRLTGYLVAAGIDVQVVREVMLGWNLGMCDPPISDKEVVGAVVRIAEREVKKQGWLV